MEDYPMENTQKKGIYRWIVLAVLVLAFTTSFFSRFIWAPLLATAAPEMNMNMGQAGSLMSTFYFGYLILQIPGGILADKTRAVKPWLAASCLLEAVFTFLMQYANNYTMASICRFGAGFSGGMIMAMCGRLLSNHFSGPERGMAFGILLASPSIGTLLANQVGPAILVSAGWRAAFSICAYVIAAIAVIIMVVIKEPKVEKVANAGPAKASLLDGLKNYFTNPQILILSLAGFLFMAVPPGYSTWANKFMTGACALTPADAGNIVTVYSIFSIIGAMSSGFITKKFHIDPKTFIMVIYILMAGSIVMFGMQTSFTGLMIWSAIFGLISCMSSGSITTWAVNMGGSKFAGTTTSTQNLLFQMANVIFPTVAGNIIDGATVDGVVTSYMGVWYLYGILMVGGFIVIAFASRKKSIESMK